MQALEEQFGQPMEQLFKGNDSQLQVLRIAKGALILGCCVASHVQHNDWGVLLTLWRRHKLTQMQVQPNVRFARCPCAVIQV